MVVCVEPEKQRVDTTEHDVAVTEDIPEEITSPTPPKPLTSTEEVRKRKKKSKPMEEQKRVKKKPEVAKDEIDDIFGSIEASSSSTSKAKSKSSKVQTKSTSMFGDFAW